MEVKITRPGDEIHVRLIGRLDTPAAQEVGAQLAPLEKEAAGTIILDCKELTYISSSGLRIFLALRKAAAAQGGRVIVRGMDSNIRSVFMMTGFLNLFTIED